MGTIMGHQAALKMLMIDRKSSAVLKGASQFMRKILKIAQLILSAQVSSTCFSIARRVSITTAEASNVITVKMQGAK